MSNDKSKKAKRKILDAYTDYSARGNTQAKIEQYKSLLDYIKKDCRDEFIEALDKDMYDSKELINQEVEYLIDDIEENYPKIYSCDSQELSRLYNYNHGLLIPEDLKSLYKDIGFFSVGSDHTGLDIFNPKRVFFEKGFNTFILDADYFNGFRQFVGKDKCDFLEKNYCFIGTARRYMEHFYILFEKSGRGFITLSLEEDDLSETMDEDVDSLCNLDTAKFCSLDETLTQGFFEATHGLLHSLGLDS